MELKCSKQQLLHRKQKKRKWWLDRKPDCERTRKRKCPKADITNQNRENGKLTGVTGRHGTEMKRKDQKEMKDSEVVFESKIWRKSYLEWDRKRDRE